MSENNAYNNYHGKQILAEIRDGDFAHPGEAAAIELLLKHLPIRSYPRILDVGAGLGATLKIIANHFNCINAYGTDIDKDSIAYASSNFPEFEWVCCDTQYLSKSIAGMFDLIYFFNSFYCIPNQNQALDEICMRLSPGGIVAISDYSDLRSSSEDNFINPFAGNSFKPLANHTIAEIKDRLNIITKIDISDYYSRWYQDFLAKMKFKQNKIVNIFGKEAFDEFFNKYQLMLEDILASRLGGVIIIAKNDKDL